MHASLTCAQTEVCEPCRHQQVLGTFANGRVEAYLEGMRHLEPEEMAAPAMAPRIARRLAQFHAVDLQEPRAAALFETICNWCAARGCNCPGRPTTELDAVLKDVKQWPVPGRGHRYVFVRRGTPAEGGCPLESQRDPPSGRLTPRPLR